MLCRAHAPAAGFGTLCRAQSISRRQLGLLFCVGLHCRQRFGAASSQCRQHVICVGLRCRQ
eukprot:1276372-Prymnesium_polylepis.1